MKPREFTLATVEYVDGALVDSSAPSDQRAWSALREQRDVLLRASDWTQLADIPEAIRTEWVAYRQALRDLPATIADPWT